MITNLLINVEALDFDNSTTCFGFVVEADEPTYEFGITSLENKKEFLQRGDHAQFQLEKVTSAAPTEGQCSIEALFV